MSRILVTGSRNWKDVEAVYVELNYALDEFGWDSVFVHGDCPFGVDYIVRQWCEHGGLDHEPHPADWEHKGRAAGPIRNRQMVELGADVCLAFPLGESRGTRGCMVLADAAGIPVRVFGEGA